MRIAERVWSSAFTRRSGKRIADGRILGSWFLVLGSSFGTSPQSRDCGPVEAACSLQASLRDEFLGQESVRSGKRSADGRLKAELRTVHFRRAFLLAALFGWGASFGGIS